MGKKTITLDKEEYDSLIEENENILKANTELTNLLAEKKSGVFLIKEYRTPLFKDKYRGYSSGYSSTIYRFPVFSENIRNSKLKDLFDRMKYEIEYLRAYQIEKEKLADVKTEKYIKKDKDRVEKNNKTLKWYDFINPFSK